MTKRKALIFSVISVLVLGGLIFNVLAVVPMELFRHSSDPLQVKVLHIAGNHPDSLRLTVRISRLGTKDIILAGEQSVQFKTDGRWGAPEIFWRFNLTYWDTREITLTVPRRIEACRFLLDYQRSPPCSEAHRFLYKHGIYTHMTRLSQWIEQRFPQESPWKRATIQVTVLQPMDATRTDEGILHNAPGTYSISILAPLPLRE
jgi:hypothetical protein